MNKLNYGNYNASISDIAFSATNGYSDPASELETRKQLSYPLKEVKDFVNNTVSVDHEDNAIQFVLSEEGKLQYRTSPDGELIDVGGGTSIDAVYPVGSIYMSVNSTDPGTLFSGTTWEQLKDRFLLGAGDTYTAGTTGGEATHTLTLQEIPSHNHSYTARSTSMDADGYSGDVLWRGTTSGTTGNAGGGQAHNNLPPYLVVYMWKRTA